MPDLGDVLFELKRRNVFRVTVLYVIIAWLLLQVADIVIPALSIPDWGIRFVLVILALGFPLAVFFAWAFELTPEGLKREKEVDRTQSITPRTGRKLDVIIICFLLVAVAVLVLDNYVFVTPEEPTPGVIDDSVKSIAVLPFVNLSDDPANEYFSDGLAEELLNVLVRVDEIRVASRTSSFQFKDQEIGIPEIARELKVNHIVEGSVRKAGNRVRVTAQLIDVVDDRHLWSNTYERELEDIFAIQDEIAEKIVEALKVALGGEEARALARSSRQTQDLEAFEMYLQGKHLWRQRNVSAIEESIEKLEQVIAIDPEFARGYSALAMAWGVYPSYSDQIDYTYAMDRAGDYARRAIDLDAGLANPYAVLGLIAELMLHWADAEEEYKKAISLQSGEASAYHWYAIALYRLGMVEAALTQILKAYELDPGNGSIAGWVGQIYMALGEPGKALDYYSRSAEIGWQDAPRQLRIAYLRKGDFEKATESYRDYIAIVGSDNEQGYADSVMRAIESNDADFRSELHEDPKATSRSMFGALVEDLVLLGKFDAACKFVLASSPINANNGADIAWTPLGSGFRKAECFKDVVQHYKFPDYWRERGWPEFCRPAGDSFTCW